MPLSLTIRHFRSFGEDGITLDDVGRINVFIGKNNTGKSNVLTFLRLLCDHQSDFKQMPLQSLENSHNRNGSTASLEIRMRADEFSQYFEKILTVFAPDKIISFIIDLRKGELILGQEFHQLSNHQLLKLQTQYSGADDDHLRNEISRILFNLVRKVILQYCEKLIYIPHFRQVAGGGGSISEKQLSGENIIPQLFRMQNPKAGNEVDRDTFNLIRDFIRDLIGNQSIQIEIPHTQDSILVEMHNNRLPLESFGTGIHELVILCSALAIYAKHTFCFEEPELHLHPDLQRKLYEFICTRTSNNYFITTHSNVFIDLEREAHIYHVSHDGSRSSISRIGNDLAASTALHDLGYKASDLLQTNAIVWVEGPSDRHYVNRWLSLLSPELIEGLHYSVMFYGGRLLAHLSMSSDPEDDFIKLLRLNRNAIIVIDRDGISDDARLNSTKSRIQAETNGDLCWITSGREIENYLSLATLTRFLAQKECTPPPEPLDSNQKLGDWLKSAGIAYENSKAPHAKVISEFIELADLEVLDLKKRVEDMRDILGQWNRLS